ncbi:DUF4177 domain-containing protein [Sulfitobacter sp. SK012]|uniref:DUF4177 domain-containing protein n=1 Tax=Sulfitobacter sp. SK012 TaxID=1389005 RepID=UPI000E0C3920|nr:DUF4177 domain-containing protein [Sulfitobacter sp. SK012]AXI46032.1 DUF4177 domain-containing protein [Sulfitobacter sp. SK012]
MPRFEYKVVPAPTKGLKAKGVRTAEARFSNALQDLMNELSSDGWEYLRAETLPSTERSGLTGSTTEWRNVMIFRRPRESDTSDFQPELLPAPTQEPVMSSIEKEISEPEIKEQPTPVVPGAVDNIVEDTPAKTGISTTLSLLAAKRNASKSED